MKNDPKKRDSRIRCESCNSRYNPNNILRKRRHESGACVSQKSTRSKRRAHHWQPVPEESEVKA